MPREFIVASPEPITAVDCVSAVASVDPNLGLGRLWNGGGLQIADEAPVLAVLRSVDLGDRADAELLIGSQIPHDAMCLTEAYGPFDHALTERLMRRLTSDVNGTLFEMKATR